jgi:seryl-tRNA synthetase
VRGRTRASAAAKCYDLETFAPGVDKWLEVSSCSNFEDFQARRAEIRLKEGRRPLQSLFNTLNGSGLGRCRASWPAFWKCTRRPRAA